MDNAMTYRKALAMLPKRPPDSHKGDFGRLLLICGSESFAGAAALSVEAALKSGVGIAELATVKAASAVACARNPEAVLLPFEANRQGGIPASALPRLQDAAKKATAVLIGCGLGQSAETKELLLSLLPRIEAPLILDADALNILSDNREVLKSCKGAKIITPHIGEFSRLCQKSRREISEDMQRLAGDFSREYNCVTVLKSHNTAVASPNGESFFHEGSNSVLSRGGSGDVLAGLISSLTAQHMNPFDAACAAVTLHFEAAKLAAEKYSVRGALPHEFVDELRTLFLKGEQN